MFNTTQSVLRHFVRVGCKAAVSAAVVLTIATISVAAESSAGAKPSPAEIAHSTAAASKLSYRLTTIDEFTELMGPASSEMRQRDGGRDVIVVDYPDVQAVFSKPRRTSVPFTLYRLVADGRVVDIGQERQMVLRSIDDLQKLDAFWGLVNISVGNLDLSSRGDLLESMPFDSRTKWPGGDRLPEGFDPGRLLEEGKNPGLGIRALHKEGIDGRGVGIAILDQALLKNHVEYVERIVHYEGINVQGMPPQMHGPSVASIAVGKTCGVSPGARLSYYAMRATTMPDNKIYCDIIDRIIESNRDADGPDRIRVVSISTGMFAQQANFDRWKETLRKAEQEGILVVTCAQDLLPYGTLARIPGRDPDDPRSYRGGRYGVRPGALLAPAGNRTTASHGGPQVYTYWTVGGMSWVAPYLAGLAALAYQVDPDIRPETIVKLLVQTATPTEIGLVVNPARFIEAVRKSH